MNNGPYLFFFFLLPVYTINMEIVLLLILALFIDLLLGEPPALIHPVVWMGKMISLLTRGGTRHAPVLQFVLGLGVTLFIIALFSAPVYFLLAYLHHLNLFLYVIIGAVIFKSTFSLRELRRAAQKIRDLLKKEKLLQARFELRALVGRDTRQLDKSQIISATVESIAENICDSFFAPLFYFAFLGVTGAVAYRAINTLDAMIGHHGEYEYLGKFAAGLDTVANFIPARLAALAIVLATYIIGPGGGSAWRTMFRDSSKTASPNAGWTMSAMAGALGVQLEKVGYYKLGRNYNVLALRHIDMSLNIVTLAAAIWSIIIIFGEVVYHAAT
jgi:adenosylcobinamide-phosphate synthase